MPGRNYFSDVTTVLKSLSPTSSIRLPENWEKVISEIDKPKKCVFISYKGDDLDVAKDIANYLTSVGINIFFDREHDLLTHANTQNDYDTVVSYIEAGISISSHMLAVVSDKTKNSWWVPFEIGSARRKSTEIAHVVTKEVFDLPAFLRISEIITSDEDLEKWVKKENVHKSIITESGKSIDKPSITRLPLYKKAINFV
ncbi:toll/interleukin-1 receptor domain-containing protein [Deinococcus cellulosilyticus]|uniref:TIR domain-containing protein n=1 Tax=Deinococcus cellulosilyticus (strain DSM 18568 / NBRC 106333 / KACC 11606 / 5516J-15) TaxID=1223518 RepID=A0A511N8J1_DEIC1|nr:toll/interleukin-1 receptor domain-containing protein [Deinococcus cellulosilyticus]GEM48711.1 hypothetical protein DC3_43460 [Deinococcus cellulosilyticus NBRC 106333 = KACC 11606]